jgi:uncharacterized protein YecE (DUF72 family)
MASNGYNQNMKIRVGCAGWSVPTDHAEQFPEGGSHLERYAQRVPLVEINSSFYRSHQPATYARWAAAVPADFRFAVKVPREITHTRRLQNPDRLVDQLIAECSALGEKLGPLLVQLPPSLHFDAGIATAFFRKIRERSSGDVVCEPRHPSWFMPEADQMLTVFHVARVAADPASFPQAARPGGWDGLVYCRLHGSPRVYYSAYSDAYLAALVTELRIKAQTAPVWCVFDNTAAGAATANALTVLEQLR